MLKVQPVYHAGMEVVQLSGLPPDQFDFLSEHISSERYIEIHISGEDAELCVPYRDYEYCFQLLCPDHFDIYFDSQL